MKTNILVSLFQNTIFSYTFEVTFFYFAMGSDQSVNNPMPLSTITHRQKLKTLNLKTNNSFPIFENAQNGTEQNNTGKTEQVELYIAHFN